MSRSVLTPLLVLLSLAAAPAAPSAADPAQAAAEKTADEGSDASSLDLAALQGKVVYLDFWASWCVPCRKSFPWLNEMQHKYGEKGLVVIGVNVDRERKAADGFLKKYAADFRIVYDPEGKLAEKYDLQGMPSTFVYGRDGKQAFTHVGFRESEAADVERTLKELLAKENRS